MYKFNNQMDGFYYLFEMNNNKYMNGHEVEEYRMKHNVFHCFNAAGNHKSLNSRMYDRCNSNPKSTRTYIFERIHIGRNYAYRLILAPLPSPLINSILAPLPPPLIK